MFRVGTTEISGLQGADHLEQLIAAVTDQDSVNMMGDILHKNNYSTSILHNIKVPLGRAETKALFFSQY